MHLQIITPKGISHDGEVERVQFTSADGMMEWLPGHADMVAQLCEGIIDTGTEQLPCGNGVLRIENDKITVVCE